MSTFSEKCDLVKELEFGRNKIQIWKDPNHSQPILSVHKGGYKLAVVVEQETWEELYDAMEAFFKETEQEEESSRPFIPPVPVKIGRKS